MSDNNDTSTTDNFQQELQTQIDKIDKAIAALPEGEIGDLQELDRDVSDLCSRLENAPREVAQDSEPLMSRMIARLEELEQKLRAHQDELNLGGETGADDKQDSTGSDSSEESGDGDGDS